MDPEQKLGKYFSKDWSRERPEVRPWRPGEALGGGPALPLAAPGGARCPSSHCVQRQAASGRPGC